MTATLRGMPPGRAGRLWLRHRLAVAAHSADLLEQKLRILAGEEQSFALLADRRAAEWRSSVADLDRWVLRSALLSGENGLRASASRGEATVDIEWRVTMGVRLAADATCVVPTRDPTEAPPDNSALVSAIDAAERTVRAAVDQATAEAALDAVRAEMAATRRQLRAVRDRWIPRLEAAHAALTVALEDQEHDEGVRLRWAANREGTTAQTTRTVRR
jgi:V/A-type H+/Na+-transporting ATPase subunit D